MAISDINIPPFPTLQPEILAIDRLTYDFSFSNGDPQEWKPLKPDFENNTVFKIDSKIWSADDFNLKVKIDLQLSGVKKLFSGDQAIADENAEIGVAVRWQIAGMFCRQFTVFDNCSLTKENDCANGQVTFIFPPHFLRRQLNFELILYLKDSNPPDQKNLIYARVPGSLLGVIDQKSLITGGGQGTFNTIWEKAGTNAPLWRMILNFSSLDEPFTQNSVVLSLNENHCASGLIYIDKKEKISPMLFEIFADACFILLKAADRYDLHIKEDIGAITTVEDYLNVMIKRLFPEWGTYDRSVDDQVLMVKIREVLSKNLPISKPRQPEERDEQYGLE